MEDKLSFQSLEPHLKNLRACGFYRLNCETPRYIRFIHTVYMRFVLFWILLFATQQLMNIVQVRCDVNKVINTLFLFLTNSDAIYKQIVLWRKSDKIYHLLNTLKGEVFNQSAPQHQAALAETARHARLLLRSFNCVALITCMLWALYPLIIFTQGKPVEFAIWLPFNAHTAPQFYWVNAYVWLITSWIAYNNTTMDAFISFFLAQSTTQLFILRMDLETIVARSKEQALVLSKPWIKIYNRNFRKILMHHNEILKFSQEIQEIFGGAVLYQFIVSGWIMCTAAYRTVDIHPASVEFMSMIMYMGCMLTELLLYCYYGNEVNYESGLLTKSAYAVEWLEIPLRHRKDLVIFMEGIKRHIAPMAGPFIPLSMATFVSILRSSYSFYAFLKNTD